MATQIAESLKRFRSQFNLKQKNVADTLGISQQAYYPYERDTYPSAKLILKLADAYDVSADYLLGRTNEPNPKKYDDKEVAEAFALRDAIKAVMAK